MSDDDNRTELQPHLPLVLPKLDDAELAGVIHWGRHVFENHREAAPRFGDWLSDVLGHEILRRTSDGSVEVRSFPIPELSPRELGRVLAISTAASYMPLTKRQSAFIDGVNTHVVALAMQMLSEFEELCEIYQAEAADEN